MYVHIRQKVISVIPSMYFFKTSSKTTFVDDDIVKGIMYFYRVSAANRVSNLNTTGKTEAF